MGEYQSRYGNAGDAGAPYCPSSDTSKAAAQKVATKVERDRENVLRFIAQTGGAIWDEIWEPLKLSPTSNGRITELHFDGLIRDSGERRKTRTGCGATVWVVTEKGEALLRESDGVQLTLGRTA